MGRVGGGAITNPPEFFRETKLSFGLQFQSEQNCTFCRLSGVLRTCSPHRRTGERDETICFPPKTIRPPDLNYTKLPMTFADLLVNSPRPHLHQYPESSAAVILFTSNYLETSGGGTYGNPVARPVLR